MLRETLKQVKVFKCKNKAKDYIEQSEILLTAQIAYLLINIFHQHLNPNQNKQELSMLPTILIFFLCCIFGQSAELEQFQFSTIRCNISISKSSPTQGLKITSCQWKECQKWNDNLEKKVCASEMNAVSHEQQTCLLKCYSYQIKQKRCKQLNPPNWQKAYLVFAIVGLFAFFKLLNSLYAYIIRMNKSIHEEEVCAICIQNQVNVRLGCNHYYHVRCIFTEMKLRYKCPICRTSIKALTVYCKICRFAISSITSADFKAKRQRDYCKLCK